MPEFSACYFCGTALDAPLAEYPVIPDALHPAADQQRTVVLCPSCRRKLGAVVDAVVDAVDDAPGDDSIQQPLDSSRGNGSYTDDDEENVTAERLDTDADPSSAGPETEETDHEPAQADEPTSGEASPAEGDDPLAEADSPDSASNTGADSGFDFEGDDSEPTSGPSAGSEAEEPDDTDEELTPAEEQARAAARSNEDSSEPDSGESEEGSVEDDPQMTALEYNKVMRLLQNREFPVDREEFKVVATNAYGIEDDEFDAVIEAAAKRDLIGLEGGNIVDS